MVGNLFSIEQLIQRNCLRLNPEGKDNLKRIKEMIKMSDLVICWGNKQGSPPKYLRELSELHYLKLLKS